MLEIKVTVISQDDGQAAPANEVKEFTSYKDAVDFFAGRVESVPQEAESVEGGESSAEGSDVAPGAESGAVEGSEGAQTAQSEGETSENA